MTVINGNRESNILIGTKKSDFIAGSGGNDYIFSGNGSDWLSGGEGEDVFVFKQNQRGVDHISDLESHDVIMIDVKDNLATIETSFIHDSYAEDCVIVTENSIWFDPAGRARMKLLISSEEKISVDQVFLY